MQIQVGAVPEFPGYPQRAGVAGLGDTPVDPMVAAYGYGPKPVYGADGCAPGMRLDPSGVVCIPENSPVFSAVPAPMTLPPAPISTLNNASWCGQGLVYDPADGSCNPLALPPSIPTWVWAVAAGLVGLGLLGGRR
jgi:hypothetical protein